MAVGGPDKRVGGLRAGAARTVLLAWADSFLCVAVLALLELLAVAARAWHELAGPFEVVRVLVGLGPQAVTLALIASLPGAALLLALAARRGHGGRIVLAFLGGALGLYVAWGTSGGRLLAGGARVPFVAVVTAVAAAIAWAAHRRLGWAARRHALLGRRGTVVVIASTVGLLAALHVGNARLLPRLYPALHDGLVVVSLLVATLAAAAWQPWRSWFARDAEGERRWSLATQRVGDRRMMVALSLAAAAAGFTPSAARRFATQDNLRLIYLERSPMLAYVVRLSAELAPPPPLEDDAEPAGPPSGARYVDFSGRDMLLVTIDALRADHVGALGYDRATTPRIDALAADGVLFEQAYSPTPHTSYAVASLLTGKHLRPLMQQGLGTDSETWADALRRYDYRTAAFFPPAAFYIDPERFVHFAQSGLGFEYRKVEFAPAEQRVGQLEEYLRTLSADQRVFVWVHLFEPHEPYELHAAHDFGDRAIDRYDSEVAQADAGVGKLVDTMRRARPGTVVIVAADHGEEFEDHGGRYHGTTVYDEQVRVPLLFNAPGLLAARRVAEPVSLVDLLPTALRSVGIPLSPKIHGRDLGPLLVGQPAPAHTVMAETDELTLLAKGTHRLVCARRVGACRLFDTETDPGQRHDLGSAEPETVAELKRQLGRFMTGLGRYEIRSDSGSGSAGAPWPPALRRAMAGEGDAALDAAALLDDADVAVRRLAARALFELRRIEAAPQLQRTLRRDEDDLVRRWCALALTRLGQGAPLTLDLLTGAEVDWQRLAALALAEAGDDRGEELLVRWWNEAFPAKGADAEPTGVLSFERAKDLVAAFAKLRSEKAVPGLIRALRSVRLRKLVAGALGAIGEEVARPALVGALRTERYVDTRLAMVRALVALGASGELRDPMVWLLGVPDPLPEGLGLALEADILELVGGPRDRLLARLREYANSGVAIDVAIPESERPRAGFRVVVRARSMDGEPGLVRFGLPARGAAWAGGSRSAVPSQVPPLDPARSVSLTVPPSDGWVEVHERLPEAAAATLKAGKGAEFAVYATHGVRVDACAVVPLSEELPPPPPEPWRAGPPGAD